MKEIIIENKQKVQSNKKNKSKGNNGKVSRNFLQDLDHYLSEWSLRNTNSWKFNKILQSWAIDNCLDKNLIPKNTFLLFVRYADTIRGAARTRLQSIANSAIESEEALSSKSRSKRANRIINILNEL
jgi:hypothetical protein